MVALVPGAVVVVVVEEDVAVAPVAGTTGAAVVDSVVEVEVGTEAEVALRTVVVVELLTVVEEGMAVELEADNPGGREGSDPSNVALLFFLTARQTPICFPFPFHSFICRLLYAPP